jgi:signal transduction histidine kinase
MARILLAGPDEDSRAAVRRAIGRRAAHEILEVGDGPSVLERATGEPVDLIVLDVALPGLDGFEVCRHLRAAQDTEHLPVVFVTGGGGEVGERLRGLELGAADFIVQPIDDLELGARLCSVLRSKALADEVRRHNIELAGKVVERTRQLEELASELRLERDILRETFDVFAEPLLLLDGAGRVQIENDAGRRLLQRGVAGIAELAELARQAIDAHAVRDVQLAQEGRQLEVRAYPAAGRRALVYVRDVTAARDAELLRLQSEKLTSIGMLAAGVAHEINNPASFVLANLESLTGTLRSLEVGGGGDGTPCELMSEALTTVQESKDGMARIYRIVRDLQAFSRVDDGAGATTDVNAAVESALNMLRNELRHRAVVDRDLSAGQRVRGGAGRLAQVFLNLILNAAQALPEGNVEDNRLRVRTFDDGQAVVIEVEDNGPGIAAEIMPRIFDSFFTTKPAGVGTGLGLPISREIVRSLAGELTAQNLPCGGALFRVRVPAAEPGTADDVAAVPAEAHRRRRIVAVDDEPLLLKAYRRMLAEHHDLVTRVGADEALCLFAEDRAFEVILCDLQMPAMSGAELYKIVAERWPELASRFIFITGGAVSAEARRFLDESVITCLNKPFQLDELLALIEARAPVD